MASEVPYDDPSEVLQACNRVGRAFARFKERMKELATSKKTTPGFEAFCEQLHLQHRLKEAKEGAEWLANELDTYTHRVRLANDDKRKLQAQLDEAQFVVEEQQQTIRELKKSLKAKERNERRRKERAATKKEPKIYARGGVDDI